MRLFLVVEAMGFDDVHLGISGAFFVALTASLLTAVPPRQRESASSKAPSLDCSRSCTAPTRRRPWRSSSSTGRSACSRSSSSVRSPTRSPRSAAARASRATRAGWSRAGRPLTSRRGPASRASRRGATLALPALPGAVQDGPASDPERARGRPEHVVRVAARHPRPLRVSYQGSMSAASPGPPPVPAQTAPHPTARLRVARSVRYQRVIQARHSNQIVRASRRLPRVRATEPYSRR